MSAAEGSLLNRLLSCAPLARLRQVVFAATARLHLLRLDRLRPDRAQLRTLLGLVHRARRSLFGREHDFARVRTAEDYRRLVPLRPPSGFAREATDGAALTVSHRRALTTALALLSAASPRARLLQGRLACAEHRRNHLPGLVRPSLHSPQGVPPSCVIGEDAIRLPDEQARVGLLTLPQAPIAAEDPRFAGWRLLVDHGVYFEFVPAALAQQGNNPPRLDIGDVRPGENYELAITSPGGWWACRSGLFVAFERLCPPLFRLVAPVPIEPAGPPPMLRSSDLATTYPESAYHWAMRADRV